MLYYFRATLGQKFVIYWASRQSDISDVEKSKMYGIKIS